MRRERSGGVVGPGTKCSDFFHNIFLRCLFAPIYCCANDARPLVRRNSLQPPFLRRRRRTCTPSHRVVMVVVVVVGGGVMTKLVQLFQVPSTRRRDVF